MSASARLFVLLAYLAACAQACVEVKALNSPINILNIMVTDLLSLVSLTNGRESLRIVQIYQNSAQTEFKFLIMITEASKIKSYMGIRSVIVNDGATQTHQITKFVQSDSISDVEAIMSARYGVSGGMDCPELKEKFIEHILTTNTLKEWLEMNMNSDSKGSSGRRDDGPLSAFFFEPPNQKALIARLESNNIRCGQRVEELTNKLKDLENQATLSNRAEGGRTEADIGCENRIDSIEHKCKEKINKMQNDCAVNKDALARKDVERVKKLNLVYSSYIARLEERCSNIESTLQEEVNKRSSADKTTGMKQLKDKLEESNRNVVSLKDEIKALEGDLRSKQALLVEKDAECASKLLSLSQTIDEKQKQKQSLSDQASLCTNYLEKRNGDVTKIKEYAEAQVKRLSQCIQSNRRLQEKIARIDDSIDTSQLEDISQRAGGFNSTAINPTPIFSDSRESDNRGIAIGSNNQNRNETSSRSFLPIDPKNLQAGDKDLFGDQFESVNLSAGTKFNSFLGDTASNAEIQRTATGLVDQRTLGNRNEKTEAYLDNLSQIRLASIRSYIRTHISDDSIKEADIRTLPLDLIKFIEAQIGVNENQSYNSLSRTKNHARPPFYNIPAAQGGSDTWLNLARPPNRNHNRRTQRTTAPRAADNNSHSNTVKRKYNFRPKHNNSENFVQLY